MSDSELLESIELRLLDKEKRKELAKSIEENFLLLYQNLNLIERLETGMSINFDGESGKVYIKSDWKHRPVYSIKHYKKDLAHFWGPNPHAYGAIITLEKERVSLEDDAFTFFDRSGSVYHMLNFYAKTSKHPEGENALKRVLSLIQMPNEVLKAAQRKIAQRKDELDLIIQKSKEGLFDIGLAKKAYDTNPAAFKQIFGNATEEQKKMMIQELIRSQESNKELNKWLEDKHKEITEEAGRDYISEEKWK